MKSWLTVLTAVSIGAALAWPSAASAKRAETMTAAGSNQAPGQIAAQTKAPMESDGIIRLGKIEIYPQYLAKYLKYVTEVGQVSLLTEPGVLTMYALSEKDDPCKITILETYASQAAYKAHIASEHFQKYKQATLHMVKDLLLVDQTPLNPANKIINLIQPEEK